METGNPEGLTGLRAGDIARLVGGARVVPRGGGGRVTRIAARPEDGGPDALAWLDALLAREGVGRRLGTG